jgi:hypothetical protein
MERIRNQLLNLGLTTPAITNPQAVALQATGTTDNTPVLVTLPITLGSDSGCIPLTTTDATMSVSMIGKERHNPLENQGVDADCDCVIQIESSSGERTRTSDPRLMNPLL